MSGHRRATEMMMPLSIEKESVGRPCKFHDRMATGSPTISCKSNFSDMGTPFSSHSFCQPATASRRKGMVNGPRYAITADESNTSPTRRLYLGPRDAEISPQRVFSPPSPPMSFSARSSLALQSSYLASSSCLVLARSASLASIVASLSMTSLSSACLTARPFIASAYSPSATLSVSFFGATTLATRSYISIARTHLQRPSHAEDALAIFSGKKSSLVQYCSRMRLMILGGMLSLS
mmetsp:Transcript_3023/g.9074  ORF Transcript_3023/g.9074 Transcript_3023/m.9074 type:complete len:236 (-) Transcript_3023:8428-9135(-)